jgi:membrane associated rhomboid family serine protease
LSLEVRNDEPEIDSAEAEEPQPEAAVRFGVPVYTSILIASVVAVSAAQIFSGLERSIESAGFVKPVFSAGEYWRILTGAALHGGLLHLALNSFAFYSFGQLVEVLSNRAHLAIVFLLAAIGGGLLSLAFFPEGTAVGASGGILGLVSYLAVYAFRRRQFVSVEFRNSLLKNIGFILIFGLVLYQVIDNYGHIGGLIVGALYGFVQIPSDPHRDPREVSPAVDIAGLVAVGIFVAAAMFSIYLILQSA